MFGHPFLNELICFSYDFSRDDELVDYYVSFLKSLSLQLTQDTIHFFFNDKFNTFPLLSQAIRFFNHKESMVRTSVRTITLNVFNCISFMLTLQWTCPRSRTCSSSCPTAPTSPTSPATSETSGSR